MKIALVCNEYPPRPHGGIGSFVRDLARSFAAGGHEVLVAGWGHEAGAWRDGAVRVVTLPEWPPAAGRKLVNRLRLKRFLEREVRAGRVDVVEAPDYEGSLPWGVRGVPVVVRLHMTLSSIERAAGRTPNPKTAAYERRQLAANRSWIGVSRHVLDLTRREFGLAPALSKVISNPVPPAADVDAPALPEPYVLFAGAISEGKGALEVARAAREFLPSHPAMKLAYVGAPLDGYRRSTPDAIREILGPLADRVVFTGWVPRAQVRGAMRRAAAFVFPSRHESSSLVTLEAMSEGCPVVVSNEPPFTELVADGETGLLVPPCEPLAIAAAVSRLLDDGELRGRLVSAARASVAALHPERNAAETLAFYGDVLAHHRKVDAA